MCGLGILAVACTIECQRMQRSSTILRHVSARTLVLYRRMSFVLLLDASLAGCFIVLPFAAVYFCYVRADPRGILVFHIAEMIVDSYPFVSNCVLISLISPYKRRARYILGCGWLQPKTQVTTLSGTPYAPPHATQTATLWKNLHRSSLQST